MPSPIVCMAYHQLVVTHRNGLVWSLGQMLSQTLWQALLHHISIKTNFVSSYHYHLYLLFFINLQPMLIPNTASCDKCCHAMAKM